MDNLAEKPPEFQILDPLVPALRYYTQRRFRLDNVKVEQPYQQTYGAAISQVLPSGCYKRTPGLCYNTQLIASLRHLKRFTPTGCLWTANGQQLITSSTQGDVIFQDQKKWTSLGNQTVTTGYSPVRCLAELAVSSGTPSLVLAANDMGELFQLTTSTRYLGKNQIHTDLVHAITVSPTQGSFATASGDRSVRVWTLGGGSSVVEVSSFNPPGGGVVKHLQWHEVQSCMIGGGGEQVGLWDPRVGGGFVGGVKGHNEAITSVGWQKGGCGHVVVSTAMDRQTKLWDCRRLSRPIQKYRSDGSNPLCATWHPLCPDVFVVGEADGKLSFYCTRFDHVQSQVYTCFAYVSARTPAVTCAAWHPQGYVLATVGGEGVIKMWGRPRASDMLSGYPIRVDHDLAQQEISNKQGGGLTPLGMGGLPRIIVPPGVPGVPPVGPASFGAPNPGAVPAAGEAAGTGRGGGGGEREAQEYTWSSG